LQAEKWRLKQKELLFFKDIILATRGALEEKRKKMKVVRGRSKRRCVARQLALPTIAVLSELVLLEEEMGLETLVVSPLLPLLAICKSVLLP